jgi:hypothetical protein
VNVKNCCVQLLVQRSVGFIIVVVLHRTHGIFVIFTFCRSVCLLGCALRGDDLSFECECQHCCVELLVQPSVGFVIVVDVHRPNGIFVMFTFC